MYLAGIALVGVITVGIFFGVGLYSLVYPTAGTAAAVSSTPNGERAAPILAMPETSPAAGMPTDTAIVPPVATALAVPDGAEPPAGKRWERASSETVSGEVSEVPDAMTWVVADHTVQLWGVRPGPQRLAPALLRFVDWVRTKGPVVCQKHVRSNRYQCSTATGEDIAEAALVDGLGRAAEGAARGYRDAEAQARKGQGPMGKALTGRRHLPSDRVVGSLKTLRGSGIASETRVDGIADLALDS